MSVQNETSLPAAILPALRAIGFGLWDPIGLNGIARYGATARSGMNTTATC